MRMLMSIVVTGTFATLAFAQPAQKANPPMREFAGQKCRFTLPGDEWKWLEPPMPMSIFSATDANGRVFAFCCGQIPPETMLDQSFAAQIEQAVVQKSFGKLQKRGGHFVIFQGLSCYQFEGRYADGQTTVSRFFLAHGLVYHLSLIGDKEPVELQPDFEKIMSGFELTEPVAAGSPARPLFGSFHYLAYAIVSIGAYIVFAHYRHRRAKRPAVVRRRPVDDDFDEIVPVDQVEAPRHAGHTGVSAAQSRRPLPKPLNDDEDSRRIDDATSWDEPEQPKGTGKCRHCGHSPLAFNAEVCPVCSGANPNPGVITRYVGRGVWVGAALGASMGATWGYMSLAGGGGPGALGGVLLGTLPGMIGGWACGFFAGILARVAGVR